MDERQERVNAYLKTLDRIKTVSEIAKDMDINRNTIRYHIMMAAAENDASFKLQQFGRTMVVVPMSLFRGEEE